MNDKRQKVYNKFNGHCAYCGDPVSIDKFEIDHIVPKRNFKNVIATKSNLPWFMVHLTESDLNHIDNLFPACNVCNKYKAAMSLETFRNEILKQEERAFKTSFNYRMALKFDLVKPTPKQKIKFYFETYYDQNPK